MSETGVKNKRLPHEVLGITAWEWAKMRYQVDYAEAVACGNTDLAAQLLKCWEMTGQGPLTNSVISCINA